MCKESKIRKLVSCSTHHFNGLKSFNDIKFHQKSDSFSLKNPIVAYFIEARDLKTPKANKDFNSTEGWC